MRPDFVAVHDPRSPHEYSQRLFFDSCVHDARTLRYLLGVAGGDCVVPGTDDRFHRTARQWPGLPAQRFTSAAEAA